MNPQSQLWIPTAVIVVGYLLGFYFNHRQLESFRIEFNSKIDALRAEFNGKVDALRAEMRQGFAEMRLDSYRDQRSIAPARPGRRAAEPRATPLSTHLRVAVT